jgi:hypothetical protein
MNKIKALLACICIVLFFSACESSQSTLSPVFSDNTCEPPCWANIHPGKTTETELRNLLQDMPSVEEGSISSRPIEGFDGIYWKFSDGSDGQVRVKNGIVWSIGFASPLNESLHITLDQAIEKYGEPESVFSRMNPNSPDWGAITFIYPKEGVTFSYATHVEKYKYKGVLRPETPITSISYFSPENYQEIYEKFYIDPPEWTAEIVNASMYPWKGMAVSPKNTRLHTARSSNICHYRQNL